MVYIAQQAFGFGEVDPNIRAQYESMMYQKGCRTLENGMLSETGSARKRWGSVYSSSITDGKKAYDFVNGYGDTFIISGYDLGYEIRFGSTVIGTYVETTGFLIEDACSTGTELFLLTSAGLFVHEFTKTTSGSYTEVRSRIDSINSDLVTSTPETTMTWVALTGSQSGRGKLFTSVTPYFQERDCGKVKFYNNGSWPPGNAGFKYIPRTNSEEIWKIAPPVDTDLNSVPLYAYLGDRQSDTTVRTYDYYSYGIRLEDGVDVTSLSDVQLDLGTISSPTMISVNVRINFNGADSLTFSNGVSDGDVLRITSNSSGLATVSTAGGSGVSVTGIQDGRYEFTFLGMSGTLDPGDNAFYTAGLELFSTSTDITGQSVDMPSYDWVGPYKNWVNVGKVLTPASVTTSGVIPDAIWNALPLGTATALSSISSSFDTDHEKCLDLGTVGRFVLYRHGVRYKTTYFYVSDKALSPTLQGQAGTLYIVAIQGNPLEAAVLADDHFTLVMQLASTDDAGVMADGRPAPRNGVTPEVLVRGSDTNGSYEVQRVGMVGCPSTSTSITSYTPVFTNKDLTSATSASITVRHTAVVGDSNPIVDSEVFRVGKQEVEGGLNLAPVSGTGVGPSAYWKLTGAAMNPTVPEGSGFTPSVLMEMKNIEYHQSRVFLAGFNPDISGSLLQRLTSTQNLGITVISTKSGSTRDFTTGELANDGLSFQINSKKGGSISWMKSHLNTLFIGTGEEEYIVADAPLMPTQINVSSQSEYGSRGNAASAVFGSNIVFIQRDGKTIRSMGYQERRRRYESDDLMQFARHITKSEVVTRIAVVGTATQYLFALTDAGKLWCLSYVPQNHVFGWSEWKNDNFTIEDILGTVDDNGNPSLFARTSTGYGIFFTSDPARGDLLVDMAVNAGTIAVNNCIPASPPYGVGSGNLSVTADGVYVGTSIAISGGIVPFPTHPSAPAVVVVGYNYTMTLAPNIPELMIPGKGSTLGREKNVSRLRVLFNQARGGTAAGYPVLTVPADNPIAVVLDEPGFHSIPVVGEYGPQPTINITQSAPYGFEISGYNAEYDFGD